MADDRDLTGLLMSPHCQLPFLIPALQGQVDSLDWPYKAGMVMRMRRKRAATENFILSGGPFSFRGGWLSTLTSQLLSVL